jgi:hypothetical protein
MGRGFEHILLPQHETVESVLIPQAFKLPKLTWVKVPRPLHPGHHGSVPEPQNSGAPVQAMKPLVFTPHVVPAPVPICVKLPVGGVCPQQATVASDALIAHGVLSFVNVPARGLRGLSVVPPQQTISPSDVSPHISALFALSWVKMPEGGSFWSELFLPQQTTVRSFLRPQP